MSARVRAIGLIFCGVDFCIPNALTQPAYVLVIYITLSNVT